MPQSDRPKGDPPGIQIKEIGSFFAGGRKVSLTDQPVQQVQVSQNAPTRTVDINGEYVTGQCYVQYVRQVAPGFDTPLMFWHGGSMTGATWETTPDGHPGWHSFFLQAGFNTFVCDAIERGRSGWSPYPQIYIEAPVFRTLNDVWTMFRLGPPEGYAAGRRPFPGVRFPLDALGGFGSQFVPRWTTHAEMTLAAYYDALRRTGPVWLIAHSQGGHFALDAAAAHPEFFKGVVTIEPASVPPETGQAAQVPHLLIWGDNLNEHALWHAYRTKADQYADQLRSDGGAVEILDLPAEGIKGNTHAMMMDDNADQIAARVLDWIKKVG